jgi:hypothetical protein
MASTTLGFPYRILGGTKTHVNDSDEGKTIVAGRRRQNNRTPGPSVMMVTT